MTSAEVGNAVRRALTLIPEHPGVDAVGEAQIDETSGVVTVNVTFAVNLPSEWRRHGESPSGVRLREELRFRVFPAGFPMDPPELSLRADFSRNLPHVQPWLADGRPVPCIYDGELAELLHREGLAGILNQTAVWLDRAALGTLIDPGQGWEPVRRDSFDDVLVADAYFLQGLVDRGGGHCFLEMEYLKWPGVADSSAVHGRIISRTVPVNRKTVGGLFGEAEIGGAPRLSRGKSLALVVWPGKTSFGQADRQRDLSAGDGRKRRRPQGPGRTLRLQARNSMPVLKLAADLLVRLAALRSIRDGGDPFWLDGPFCGNRKREPDRVVSLRRRSRSRRVCFADNGATVVRAASHHHAISRELLARMAGLEAKTERPSWTLVGAGSLGSKVALHLARAGSGPSVVVDRSGMAPHNAARHRARASYG